MDNRQYRQIVDDYADMVYRIALYAALGALPEKCRIVVHLFYFEDMGTREIAEVLGIKEPTVRTRLVRARKLLKQSLKEAWEDEQLEPVQSHDGRGPCLC